MKRTTALLVFCLVLVAAACAATNRYTRYGSIFESGEYTLKGTTYELDEKGNRTGSGNQLTLAGHAGNSFMEAEDDGQRMRFVTMDGRVYMIVDSERTVMVMDYDGTDDTGAMDMPYSIDVIASGTGKLDGKSYYYEKAYDPEGSPMTFWYNGNELYAVQSDYSVLYITSITQKADASLFEIPADYTVYDMNDLSSMFDDYSEWDTDYDYTDWSDYGSDYDDIDWESLFGDMDWSGSWGLYDTPHYYALGVLLGLNDRQAHDFEDTMNAVSGFDWDNLNDYYDAEKDRYDLQGGRLEDILYMDSADIALMRKLADRFRK